MEFLTHCHGFLLFILYIEGFQTLIFVSSNNFAYFTSNHLIFWYQNQINYLVQVVCYYFQAFASRHLQEKEKKKKKEAALLIVRGKRWGTWEDSFMQIQLI